MSKDEILHYLNAKSEYTANINLRNYTEQKFSLSFNDDGVTIISKNDKKFLKYKNFTKEDFDLVVDN